MEFEFINKIWMPRMGKGRWRKRILLGLGLLIFLLTAFQVIMEGFGGVNWVTSGFVPLMLIGIGLMGSERGGYITAACTACIRNDSLTVVYPAIDYQDKIGVHREVQTIKRESISLIQYSSALTSFRIIWTEVGADASSRKRETILYPRPEQIKSMTTAFTNVLGIQVVQMDAEKGR